MSSIIGNQTEPTITFHTTNKTDAKGRVEGVKVKTWEMTMIEKPANAFISYAVEPGFYYVACIEKTKNGERFGASQPNQYFKTEVERDAAIAKRLKKAGV